MIVTIILRLLVYTCRLNYTIVSLYLTVENILRWVIRPEDDQIKGQNMSS